MKINRRQLIRVASQDLANNGFQLAWIEVYLLVIRKRRDSLCNYSRFPSDMLVFVPPWYSSLQSHVAKDLLLLIFNSKYHLKRWLFSGVTAMTSLLLSHLLSTMLRCHKMNEWMNLAFEQNQLMTWKIKCSVFLSLFYLFNIIHRASMAKRFIVRWKTTQADLKLKAAMFVRSFVDSLVIWLFIVCGISRWVENVVCT